MQPHNHVKRGAFESWQLKSWQLATTYGYMTLQIAN